MRTVNYKNFISTFPKNDCRYQVAFQEGADEIKYGHWCPVGGFPLEIELPK